MDREKNKTNGDRFINIKRFQIGLIVAGVLGICLFFYSLETRYYLQAIGNGRAYKIDRWTGHTWLVRGVSEISVEQYKPMPITYNQQGSQAQKINKTPEQQAGETIEIKLLERPTISSSNSVDAKIGYTNLSSKNIRAVKFCMIMENILGENFTTNRDVEYLGTIKPSETVTVLENFKLWDDEGVALKKLTSLEFKDIVLKTYPIRFSVVFEDGTKIEG